MKKFVRIASFAALAVAIAGASWLVVDHNTDADAAAAKPAATKSSSSPSWLFSMTADGGTLAKNTDGTYSLTLTDVDRAVTAFSDRPDRDAAILPIRVLFYAWPKLFADSPPNAVLVQQGTTGNSDSWVFELTNPKMDGTTATFTAKIVDTKKRAAKLAGLTNAVHSATPPASLTTVSLFIDNVTPTAFACLNPANLSQVLSPPGSIPLDSGAGTFAVFSQKCDSVHGAVNIV